jgi:hypothetical protein
MLTSRLSSTSDEKRRPVTPARSISLLVAIVASVEVAPAIGEAAAVGVTDAAGSLVGADVMEAAGSLVGAGVIAAAV